MQKQALKLGELCRQVQLQLCQGGACHDVELHDDIIAEDCLILLGSSSLVVGEEAELKVTFLDQGFEVQGDVSACVAIEEGILVRFRLNQQDSLQTRMLLQLSEIEHYRNDMEVQGRKLTIDEAACEWVSQFAKRFADEFDAHH